MLARHIEAKQGRSFGTLFAASLAVGFAVVATGCPDPQQTFDDFGDRYNAINDPTSASSSSASGMGGGCAAPAAGAADGEYLFSLSAKLNPKKPIVFSLQVTTTEEGGKLKMALKATPLSAMDQMTPAGTEIDLGSYDVNADGSFDDAFGTITVPGAANPITPGADITADVTLHGELCSSDTTFICGTAEGKVTAPTTLDLKGSTFTMQFVADGDPLPAPLIDCAKDPSSF